MLPTEDQRQLMRIADCNRLVADSAQIACAVGEEHREDCVDGRCLRVLDDRFIGRVAIPAVECGNERTPSRLCVAPKRHGLCGLTPTSRGSLLSLRVLEIVRGPDERDPAISGREMLGRRMNRP